MNVATPEELPQRGNLVKTTARLGPLSMDSVGVVVGINGPGEGWLAKDHPAEVTFDVAFSELSSKFAEVAEVWDGKVDGIEQGIDVSRFSGSPVVPMRAIEITTISLHDENGEAR